MLNKIKVKIPAKINLGLNIVGLREDGYHNLETVFYPAPLFDELTIQKTTSQQHLLFSTNGLHIKGNSNDNTVMRAYCLMKDKYHEIEQMPLQITLKKNIPTQAGLGGGSADASYTLMALNEMFSLSLSPQCLADYALQLGADCPFFVYEALSKNKPQAFYAEGVGEKLMPIDIDIRQYRIKIVHTDIAISTKDAFSRVLSKCPKECCRDIVQRPISEWRDVLVNDFEQSVFALHPELARIKQSLYDCGALYAAMSGSGSAIFGLFPA